MKYQVVGLLFLLMVVLFSSCEEDEEPEQTNLRPGALIADFNGQSIDFENFAEASDIEVFESTLTGIYISGATENSSQSLAVVLMPFLGTGQYSIDNETSMEEMDSFSYWSSPPEGGVITSYSTNEGLTINVNITFFDGEILKGTYDGEIKCLDCNGNVEFITVTNGVIDVEYVGEFY